MLRPIVFRLARRAAARRLRRAGGTSTVAWALRVPLVTMVVVAAMLALGSARVRR